MDLITPGIGLMFWTTLFFLILFFLLAKFAWKPIISGINERERTITDALEQAEKAREEMANLKAENERILAEARAERDAIIAEGRQIKENTIEEAKTQAGVEAAKIVEAGRVAIEQERASAVKEIKDHVATLSLEIASKVIKSEMSSDEKQQAVVSDLLNDIKIN